MNETVPLLKFKSCTGPTLVHYYIPLEDCHQAWTIRFSRYLDMSLFKSGPSFVLEQCQSSL